MATNNPKRLQRSQLERVRLIAAGYTAREIAAMHDVHATSVEGSLNSARRRLGARNSVELVVRAIALGLVDPNEAVARQQERRAGR